MRSDTRTFSELETGPRYGWKTQVGLESTAGVSNGGHLVHNRRNLPSQSCAWGGFFAATVACAASGFPNRGWPTLATEHTTGLPATAAARVTNQAAKDHTLTHVKSESKIPISHWCLPDCRRATTGNKQNQIRLPSRRKARRAANRESGALLNTSFPRFFCLGKPRFFENG